MQYPTGAHFNIDTLRMEMSSFSDLVFNPVSQVKFVHTVMSGYVTGRHVYYVYQRLVSATWPRA